jgi:hypothetical protein
MPVGAICATRCELALDDRRIDNLDSSAHRAGHVVFAMDRVPKDGSKFHSEMQIASVHGTTGEVPSPRRATPAKCSWRARLR